MLILGVILGLFVLVLLVVLHELGHAMVAKRNGVVVEEFGIGFPPFLGGPLRYMDSLGAGEVVARLQRLATQYGSRFTPCEALVQRAERGDTFWPGDETDSLS